MANPDLWTPSGKSTAAVPVAKQATATAMPDTIAAALDAQGMNSSAQMGPGRPQNPSWGYSTRPRAMDYPVGINTSTGSSRTSWGRTSFAALRGIIDSYDVARMCINHKIDELLSMEPLFLAADGFTGDAEPAIAAARAALEFPDRELPFDAWLSKWMEDVFRYDAGTLYRRRNRAGELIGLEVVDGTTIEPKVDEYGRRPTPPAFAWEQIIKGLPTTSFTSDDLIPTIRRPQSNSPFGLAPMESVLLTANTDLKFQLHFLEMFTEGTVPAGFMELPENLSNPDQIAEFQDFWDAMMAGDQTALRRLRMVPYGTKITETRPASFDTEFAEYLMSRTAAAYGVVPQDLGLVKDVNRASGETQTDIQFRVNTLPWVNFVQGHLTRYLKYDLGLPVQVKLDTGRDKADRLQEAQAWQIYIDSGLASPDEGRQELLGLPVDNENPMPRFINSPRTGPVPLRNLFAIAGPIDAETGGPDPTQPLDTTPFDGAGGVLPDKSPGGTQFKRAPINPDDPQHPELEHVVPGSDVLGTTPSTKPLIDSPTEGAQVEATQAAADPTKPVVKEATAGVTAATGITGVDLGEDDEDDEDGLVDLTEVAKAAELASFARFSKAAAKAGKWRRDFTFTSIDPTTAAELNAQAREAVAPGKAPSPVAKSWRDGAAKAPQHLVDLKLVDHYAPLIADALAKLVTPAQIRAAIEAARQTPDDGKVAKAADSWKQAIRARVVDQLTPQARTAALEQIIRETIADGWTIGGAAASKQLGLSADGLDWATWEPGDAGAALQAADGGLASLLDSAGVGIKGIVDSSLDDLGNAIADGVLNGDSVDTIASSLSEWATGFRAERIAQTESARSVTAATLASYDANGVGQWTLVLSDGACPECEDVAAGGPYPASDSDDAPPIHPMCRCSASPVLDADTRAMLDALPTEGSDE